HYPYLYNQYLWSAEPLGTAVHRLNWRAWLPHKISHRIFRGNCSVIDRNGGLPSPAGRDVGGAIPAPTSIHSFDRPTRSGAPQFRVFKQPPQNQTRATLCSAMSREPTTRIRLPLRSRSEASSFSGAFTRLEIGHMVMGSVG